MSKPQEEKSMNPSSEEKPSDGGFPLNLRLHHPSHKMVLILKRLFGEESGVIIVSGGFKVGKSTHSLYLGEVLLETGIVKEVATNIVLDENPYGIVHIEDLQTLRKWAFSYPVHSRLLVFDEVAVHMPSTRAMSGFSVTMKALLEEASKGKLKILELSHNPLRADKAVLDSFLCRGLIICRKTKDSSGRIEYRATYISNLFQPNDLNIRQLKPCVTKFDPFQTAPFHLTAPSGVGLELDHDKFIVQAFISGKVKFSKATDEKDGIIKKFAFVYDEAGNVVERLHPEELRRAEARVMKKGLESS